MARIGIWLLVLGIGSFVLPMMGLQFRLLSALGDNAPYVGGALAAVGALLLFLGARGSSQSES